MNLIGKPSYIVGYSKYVKVRTKYSLKNESLKTRIMKWKLYAKRLIYHNPKLFVKANFIPVRCFKLTFLLLIFVYPDDNVFWIDTKISQWNIFYIVNGLQRWHLDWPECFMDELVTIWRIGGPPKGRTYETKIQYKVHKYIHHSWYSY